MFMHAAREISFKLVCLSSASRGSFVLGHLNDATQAENGMVDVSIGFIYYFALNDVANNF